MKKMLGFLVLAAVLGGVSFGQPAQAETSVSFSVSDGGHAYPHRSRHGHGHRSRWHHRPHYSSFVYAPPPVVYVEPTPIVYQAPVQYVPESSLVASPASETYYDSTGQQCREYQSTAFVGNQQSQLYGTACLQPDGAWRVID